MPRSATIKRLRPLPEFPLDYPPGSQPRLLAASSNTSLRHPYKKPILLVDLDIVRTKTRRFRAALPRVRPHFAVKANPDPRVLKVLIQEGAGFEIASIAELDLLIGLGVPPAEIFYSNPMKSRAYLEYAAAKGVEWFVVDSVEEIRKVQLGQGRREDVPAHRRAQHRQRLAARRQVRRPHERRARADRGGGRMQGRPRRRDLPRGLAVPESRQLARGHGARAQGVRLDARRGPQARACSTWAAATRCAT